MLFASKKVICFYKVILEWLSELVTTNGRLGDDLEPKLLYETPNEMRTVYLTDGRPKCPINKVYFTMIYS
mgnify:CR=1 FL=1